MNFRGATKSYRVAFGAAEPNSISTKRNVDTKKETLGNVHLQEKSNGHFIFPKWLSW